jgi:hypothetical protein
MGPVRPQGILAPHHTAGAVDQRGGGRRGERDVVGEVFEDAVHVTGVPQRDPPVDEGPDLPRVHRPIMSGCHTPLASWVIAVDPRDEEKP